RHRGRRPARHVRLPPVRRFGVRVGPDDHGQRRARPQLMPEAMDAYETYDATGLAELVKAGEVTPAELVEAAIERAERLDPGLNAIIHPNYERARRLAADVDPAAPFAGVPFLMKDFAGEEAGEPYHM